MVTEYMGIRNESFMKIAAVGTWMGDFVTAWMVRFELLHFLESQYGTFKKSKTDFSTL